MYGSKSDATKLLTKVYPTRYQYPLINYLGQKGVNHIRTIPITNSTVTWLPSGYFLKKIDIKGNVISNLSPNILIGRT